jgi:type VI secretion system protein ImpC
MTADRLQFDFALSTGRLPAQVPREDQPLRILALANLSGRAAGERTDGLAGRRPLAVDVDNLERVFGRLAPRLALEIDGTGQTIEFAGPEDFHPDHLFRRAAPFAGMRALRAELANPATRARAAAALGLAVPAEAAPAPAARSGEDAELIARLLGRPPEPAVPASAAAGVVDRLLREIVAPHVVPAQGDAGPQLMAALDAAIAERMRQVLHHPAFQALEAAWCGVRTLASRLDLGENLKLFLLDVAREEIEADIRQAGDDLARSTLHWLLCGPQTQPPDGEPWSLIVCDFRFGAAPPDAALLAALGALGAAAGAPVLAGAEPALLGCATIADLSEPGRWSLQQAETARRWQALRQSAGARWIGLALPRVLGRLPYGARLEPVDSFAFEELAAQPAHEDFLWSCASWWLALLLGQAFQEQGWSLDPDGSLVIDELPSYTWREADGESHQQPCAEVLWGEAAAQAALARGIMPVMSYRARNAARLLRWQSLALPAQPLAGAWV